jgi:hypothetical protein
MAAASGTSESVQTYVDHVNPQWVRLLRLLQMQTEYTLCAGTELHTAGGDVVLLQEPVPEGGFVPLNSLGGIKPAPAKKPVEKREEIGTFGD